MASFSHRVEIPRPPAEVFPWLLEEDKVPRWTGHLERYERLDDGPLGQGSKVRQVLDVSGRTIDVTLEITGYQPPSGAQTRFSTNGINVISSYALEAAGAGTRLTSKARVAVGGAAFGHPLQLGLSDTLASCTRAAVALVDVAKDADALQRRNA